MRLDGRRLVRVHRRRAGTVVAEMACAGDVAGDVTVDGDMTDALNTDIRSAQQTTRQPARSGCPSVANVRKKNANPFVAVDGCS